MRLFGNSFDGLFGGVFGDTSTGVRVDLFGHVFANQFGPLFGLSTPGPVAIAIGPAGSATFVLDLEGARVTYTWETDVFRSYNGLETRASLNNAPRQTYEGSAYLVDARQRDVGGQLVRAAARGDAFLLALPWEEATLNAAAVGTIVSVPTVTTLDWALPGQRVVTVGLDDDTTEGVVQTAASSAITLDVAPGATGALGGKIMPAMAVYLSGAQGFARDPVNVGMWSIRAEAALFGFAGVDTMGIGATLTTYDGLLVFDRAYDVNGTASEAMLSGAETLDYGAVIASAGAADVTDWLRHLRLSSSSSGDFQWLKAFLFAVRGRQLAWLRPTWRPDLVLSSNPGSSQLIVGIGATFGDIVEWFESLAHRRLQILRTNGTVQHVGVTAVGDNGNGTATLDLTATVTGTIDRISFLELCRLESDAVTVNFDGGGWIFDEKAHVVQQ